MSAKAAVQARQTYIKTSHTLYSRWAILPKFLTIYQSISSLAHHEQCLHSVAFRFAVCFSTGAVSINFLRYAPKHLTLVCGQLPLLFPSETSTAHENFFPLRSNSTSLKIVPVTDSSPGRALLVLELVANLMTAYGASAPLTIAAISAILRLVSFIPVDEKANP